jgi:diketogulonate reductase-like aldo/keto reductase
MSEGLRTTKRLNNGVEIPVVGLGVFRAEAGGEAKRAVLEALRVGYRHVDTARVYQNEKDVGEAIRESGIPREEIFVTTKLWNSDHGYDKAMRALETSLKKLQLEYVDLYLIHWPVEVVRSDSWRALVQLQKDGKARAIGVSNYMVHHLEDLKRRTSVVPQVNQVEQHPFLHQKELLAYCRDQGIAVEAYSPLVKATRMKHPALVKIAKKHSKTPAQVLLRWGLDHDLIVLPKSVRPERIQENADVFDFRLDAEDLAVLDALNEDHYTGWDSRNVP